MVRHLRRIPGGRNRRGLSLLEVILSIAILGGSMVVIGQIYYLGYSSAIKTRFISEANMLADAKMAELAAGVLPLESGGGQIPERPDWSYSVEVQPSLQPGLLMSTVTVTRETQGAIPAAVSLVRFFPDPDYEPEEDQG